MSVATLKEYDAKTDAKKRITLRGKAYDYYHVTEYPDGKIELEPRVLSRPFEISENTLHMVDSAAENFKKGIVSDPIDLSEFED